jgi:hypothetical protein
LLGRAAIVAGISLKLYERESSTMETSTRAGRIAVAHRLSEALRRMPGAVLPAPGPNDGATPGPIGNCGRDATDSCGMIDPEECAVHCSPADDDPALLSFGGTLQQRREQLKAARRRGL